jgi:hypothetical protein
MVRSIAVSIASALLLSGSLVAAGNPSQSDSSNSTSMWASAFQGRAFPVATPTDTCKVCFYEEANFGGESYCVGKRSASCTAVAPIAAPSTIGSVKFFTTADDCELVANVRVTVPPYDEQVDSITSDVAATGYESVVQELYIEPAGRACFLTVIDSTHYGRCYTKSATAVESTYSQQFHEVLLFKAPASDFYVVAYEGEGFNGRVSGKQSTSGLSKRFPVSSKDLSVGSSGQTLDGKISSIEYVACAEA